MLCANVAVGIEEQRWQHTLERWQRFVRSS